MTFTDTPDWMSGVYSPQLLVGKILAGTKTVTVTLPPNCESLLIVSGGTLATPTVGGVTSGQAYPVVNALPGGFGFWVASVAEAVDQQVTVTFSSNALADVYVVADAGVRLIVDTILASAVFQAGITETGTPTAVLVGGLSRGSGNFTLQPLEVNAQGRLLIASSGGNVKAHGVAANAGAVLAAPAAGTVNVIDQCLVAVATVPECVNLTGSTTGVIYASAILTVASYTVSMPMPSPLEANEQLVVTDTSASQNVTYAIHYRNQWAT